MKKKPPHKRKKIIDDEYMAREKKKRERNRNVEMNGARSLLFQVSFVRLTKNKKQNKNDSI